MLRVALDLHCVRCGSVERARATPVSAETLTDAITLARYDIPHALAAYGLMHGNDAEAGALAILQWLQRTPPRETVSERDVYRAMPGSFNATTVRAPLAVLVERSYLRPCPAPPSNGHAGRHQSARYEVNPAVYEPPRDPDGGHDQFCQALSTLCQSPEAPDEAPAGADLSVDQAPEGRSGDSVNCVKPFGACDDGEGEWEVLE
jgi:hypothetical protein